jgi:hypothetical protein
MKNQTNQITFIDRNHESIPDSLGISPTRVKEIELKVIWCIVKFDKITKAIEALIEGLNPNEAAWAIYYFSAQKNITETMFMVLNDIKNVMMLPAGFYGKTVADILEKEQDEWEVKIKEYENTHNE